MSNTLWPAPVHSSLIVLGCKIPHELGALKWKAIGRREYDLGNDNCKSALSRQFIA
jgi:hypothetical protein